MSFASAASPRVERLREIAVAEKSVGTVPDLPIEPNSDISGVFGGEGSAGLAQGAGGGAGSPAAGPAPTAERGESRAAAEADGTVALDRVFGEAADEEIAAAFDLAGASLRAAAYAMGRASSVLRIHVLGITTYILAFFALTRLTGLTGPGYAAIIGSLLALVLTGRLIAREKP